MTNPVAQLSAPVLCRICGTEDPLMRELVQVNHNTLRELDTLAKSTTSYRRQLEHVESLYLELLHKTDPAQVQHAALKLRSARGELETENARKLEDPSSEKRTVDACNESLARWVRKAENERKARSPMPNGTVQSNPNETDFTTKGRPSQLQCPFAANGVPNGLGMHTPRSSQSIKSGSRHRRPARLSFHDPISAEIIGPPPIVSAAKTDNSAVCPIRFLDQHSPEKVAEYFEKHKHEIPRSHEDCVRRYGDSESVRQLDAKYGDLTSMIRGLGQKHQPWLPEEPQEDEEPESPKPSTEKIENWAIAVSGASDPASAADDMEDATPIAADEERQPRFDRPLREIRVGESPNRPWGISIPAKYLEQTAGEKTQQSAEAPLMAPSKTDNPSKPADQPRKCPFDHTKMGMQTMPPAHPPPAPAAPASAIPAKVTDDVPGPPPVNTSSRPFVFPNPADMATELGAQGPRMVFTGPVFIGYSSQDAMAVLQQSGFKPST